jgi:putative transcription factor
MPACDMCGSPQERLLKTKIEGTELDVCGNCARFGEVIEKPRIRVKDFGGKRPAAAPMPRRKEVLQVLKPDYGPKVGKAREKLGLTQEEFARKLNEKWSIMQKIESGQFKPSIDMARKLERILKIDIIDTHDEAGEVPMAAPKKKDEGFTMGDFIKKKRK